MEERIPPSDIPPEEEPEPFTSPVEPELPSESATEPEPAVEPLPAPDLPPDFEPGIPPEATPDTQSETPTVVPPPPPPGAPPKSISEPEPVSPASERNWAMLAHLSTLLNLFTGFLGPIVALIIYLAYKERSRYIAYQSMQSFVFQLVFFIGAGLLAAIVWMITIPLMFVLIGFCLLPLAIVISLVPFVALAYGVVAAVQTSHGDDFRYWLVGDWVLPKDGSPGPVY